MLQRSTTTSTGYARPDLGHNICSRSHRSRGRRVNQQPFVWEMVGWAPKNPGPICAAKKRYPKAVDPDLKLTADLTEKDLQLKNWVLFNKKQPNPQNWWRFSKTKIMHNGNSCLKLECPFCKIMDSIVLTIPIVRLKVNHLDHPC